MPLESQTTGECGLDRLDVAPADTLVPERLGRAAELLNITSQALLAKPVARAMAARGSGRILVTASLSATTPTPFESIYGPTRAFMLSFAHGLREELGEHGVNVTAVLPGATATDFHERAGMTDDTFGSNDWKNDPDDVARQAVDALFAGRDHVVAGDRATQWAALQNTFLPERVTAHRFAKDSRTQ